MVHPIRAARSFFASLDWGRVRASVLLAVGLAAVPDVTAQLPRFFDCGDLNGYVAGEPGYEMVTLGSAPGDVSLTPPPIAVVHVAANFPGFWGDLPKTVDVLSADPDELGQIHRRTSLQLANDTVLAIDGLLPDQPYRLRLELGALAPWGEVTTFFEPPYFTYYPSLMQKGRVEVPDGTGGWRTYASNVRCTTASAGSTFGSPAPAFPIIVSSIVPLWVLATADATGRVEVRLSNDDTVFPGVYLAGFEIHEHEPLPIVYQRTAGVPLQGSTSGVGDFVTAFNAGELAGAQALALDLDDDFERGVALMHLVGWLDGSRDELFHLRDEAMDALVLAGPSHPAAAWLLDELRSLDRALAHLAASGFEEARKCAEEGGTGFLNPACADQSLSTSALTHTNANAQIAVRLLRGITAHVDGPTVLDDLVDWNSGALPAGQWEPSPLVFSAAKLTAATIVAMHPTIKVSAGDVDAVAMGALRDGLLNGFLDLGFAAVDFPRDLELVLLEQYVTQQKLPSLWAFNTYQNLFTPAQIDASWWGSAVAIPASVSGAPTWANLQRQQRSLQRAVARYWLRERRVGGALGGGLGDDVELLGQLATLMGGIQDQRDRRALDGIDDMLRWILDDSGEVQGGYFAGGMTDVEHSAEYTSSSWLASVAAFGHTARSADLGLAVGEHLRFAQDPAKAFAAPTSLGRLHFRSWWMTTDGPDPDTAKAQDILLNGRAMSPAVGTAMNKPLTESHPLVADLSQWADAWHLDALDLTGGKPLGWFGPVQFPSNVFGQGGLWWNNSGNVSDVAEISGGLAAFQLELMRLAYQRSTSPTRFLLLLPALRIFKAVIAWEDAGIPGSEPPGSSHWAAQRFKGSKTFGPLVISHVAEFDGDLDLTTVPDPLDPTAPYFDSDMRLRMRDWVEDELNGQHPGTRYALEPVKPCSTGSTSKSQFLFVGNYQNAISYYRVLYPLLTKHVIHTDRVNLTASNSGPGNLLASTVGTTLVEGVTFEPVARWRAPPGQIQDLAVLCNEIDYGSSVYSAFAHNFESQALNATLQLDAGLQPGQYLLEYGPAVQTCDNFPATVVPTSQIVIKRGAGLELDLPIPPGLNLVRVKFLADADPPAAYDLAVDPPRAERVAGPWGPQLRLTARVTNPGGGRAPASTLRLWVAPIDAEGLFVSGAVEQLLTEISVPPLDPCTGWTTDGQQLKLDVFALGASERLGVGGATTGSTPLPAAVSAAPAVSIVPAGAHPTSGVGPPAQQALAALLSGGGFQLRVEAEADGLESDLLNNQQTRGWTLEDMPVTGR